MARAVSKTRKSKSAAKKRVVRKAPARARPKAPPARRPKSRSFKLCVDFSLFPGNTALGPTFSLAGFGFSQPGGPDMFVDAAGERGLRFPDQGMIVKLPVAVPSVSMRVGMNAGPIKIVAKDKQGSQVAAQTAVFNAFGDVSMQSGGGPIAILEVTGGDNEAQLVQLCIDVALA